MRMADCDTDNYDNQTDHLPPTKVEIREDEGKKEVNDEESPQNTTQTTLDKGWSPLSEISESSLDQEIGLDNQDLVGSSASPQIAECDSAQSLHVTPDTDAALKLTTANSCGKIATPDSNHKNVESSTSPETSICAVSSTVDDDDEKDCRTVSSSFTASKSVPDRNQNFDNIFENASFTGSSLLASELLKQPKDNCHLHINRKRSNSHIVKTLLGFPGTCSSLESQKPTAEENDGEEQAKKMKLSEFKTANPELEGDAEEKNEGDKSQDSDQTDFVDSVSIKKTNNELVTKCQNGKMNKDDSLETRDDITNPSLLEAADRLKMSHTGSTPKTNKSFNCPDADVKDKPKETESVFVVSEKKEDLCKVSVVNWSKSVSQPCANSDLVQAQPVTSTVSQSTIDTIHRRESPIRLKYMSKLSTDSSNSVCENENVESVSSIQPVRSFPFVAIPENKLDKLVDKDANNDICTSEEPESKDSRSMSVDQDPLSSSVKDSAQINTSSEVGRKDASETHPNLPASVSLSSSSNLISSSSYSSSSSLPVTTTTSKSLSTPPVDSSCVTSSCKTNISKIVLKYANGQFDCQLCTFSGGQVSFEDHLFKHIEDQALRCDDCSANIYSISAWHQHLLERHEGERVLPTNVCKIIEQVKTVGSQTYNLKPFLHLATNDKPPSSAGRTLSLDLDGQVLSPNLKERAKHPESAESELCSQTVPGFLEFTFVNKEYFCLKCAKRSKDKEIFRFHIWTHTHSPESTYCCCTTLTRESCEVVANIIQLISNMNQSLITNLTSDDNFSNEKVVICRVRKTDLKLETVFQKASELKNLSLSTLIHGNRDVTTEHSSPIKLSGQQAVTEFPKSLVISAKDSETPKIAAVLKETVIVENPQRAGTDHLTVGSVVNKGCEKLNNVNSLVNSRSTEAKGLDIRAPMTKSESKISLNSFEPEIKKFKLEPDLGRIKIKREPGEDLLLADINQKILNIKKEVKEFASLTDMLCDMSSSNKIATPFKTEHGPSDEDKVLDLKVCPSFSLSTDEESKKAQSSNSSSHFSFGNKGTEPSKTQKTNFENFGSSVRSLMNSEGGSRNFEQEKRGAFYKCGFNGCQFACMNSIEFRSHLENAHKYMSVYPCAHCGHTATGEDSLLRHMQSHTVSKVFLLYKCAFHGCRFGTNLLHEFREHNEILHQHETSFRCLNCSVVFYDISDLVGHLKNNLLKFIQCPHCSVKDRNRQAVLTHISEAHPGKPKQIVVTSQVVCREKPGESANSSSIISEHPTRPCDQTKNSFLPKDDIEYIETKLKPNDIPPALKLTLERHEMANSSSPNNKNKFLPLSKEQLQHFKEITDLYLHSCKLCKYSTKQPHLLEEHMQNYHPSFLGDFIIKRQIPDSSVLPTSQKDMLYNFKLDAPKSSSVGFENKAVAKACCHLCPVAYKHVQQLKTHVRVKHPKCQRLDFYKCIHCNAKSTSKEYLVNSCKKRHPNKEFHLTRVQEVLEHPKKKSEVLDIIVNHNQESSGVQRCEHGCLPPCFQCDINSPEKDLSVIKHWKKHLFGNQGNEDAISDYEKPFVCKVFKNMVKPTKVQRHSPILTVPSAKNALPKIAPKSKSKNSSEKKKATNTTSNIDNSSDFLPPCEIGSQTLDAKLSVLYTRNRKWNRCKCCQFTTDHVATIHHHILDCHLKLYLWTCPYCDLKSIKKQNIIQHCLHFHEAKKPGAKFEDQDWNKHIRSILNLLPKDTSASTFTKQTFIISGPSSEAPNCYRLATEPLSIPASLTKPNRPTVVKLSNGVYKCSVCSTKGFVEWQVQRHIDTEHWSELKESGGKSTNNIVLNLENNQTDITANVTSDSNKMANSGRKAQNSGANSNIESARHTENHHDDIELPSLNNPSSKDEEMKAMARKIIEVSPGVLQCPFCSYRSRLRTCVKCHIWSQHMMLKRKRCKHCSFASWFDSGIEAHMATEHPRLCFSNQTTKSGYTVLVEEPDGTWKETTVNFVHASKENTLSRKRPSQKSGTSEENRKKSKSLSNGSHSKSNSSKNSLSSHSTQYANKLESLNKSSEVLNLSSKQSNETYSPHESDVSRPGVITSVKSNKSIKPGLVISPKFFKMSKSGVINLSKTSLSSASSTKADQKANIPTQNKLNLINVPKFKARDSSVNLYEENSEDEMSNGSKSSNGQEQIKSKNIFSRLLGKTEKNTNQIPKRPNNGNRRKSIEKALPDSLISINTRMEEMCVREFDEKLMRHTFTCTICSYKSTNRTTFNSHTYSHKPPAFKCGYCPFRANPRCRVTAHIRKYHKEPMIKIINLSNLPKRAIDKNPPMTKEALAGLPQKNKTSSNKSRKEHTKNSGLSNDAKKPENKIHTLSNSSSFGNMSDENKNCRESKSGNDFETDNEFNDGLDELGEEDDLYSSLTFCCHSCSFQTKNIDRFTKHTSLHNFFTHGMKVACMDCSFSTNRILDYEDHISRHMDGFLFYCGCCSFSSLEEQEVREHSLKKHPDRVISIEISPGPSSLSTKWSPVDLDPSVELTDFLAMDCERFYNLISMYGVTMVDLKSTAVSYEDMKDKSGSDDSGTELDIADSQEEAATTKEFAEEPDDDFVVIKRPLKGRVSSVIRSKKKRKGEKVKKTIRKHNRFDDPSSDDSVQDNLLNPLSDKEDSEDEFLASNKDDDDDDDEEEEEEEEEETTETISKLRLKSYRRIKVNNIDEDSDIENDGDIDDDDVEEPDNIHDSDDDVGGGGGSNENEENVNTKEGFETESEDQNSVGEDSFDSKKNETDTVVKKSLENTDNYTEETKNINDKNTDHIDDDSDNSKSSDLNNESETTDPQSRETKNDSDLLASDREDKNEDIGDFSDLPDNPSPFLSLEQEESEDSS